VVHFRLRGLTRGTIETQYRGLTDVIVNNFNQIHSVVFGEMRPEHTDKQKLLFIYLFICIRHYDGQKTTTFR